MAVTVTCNKVFTDCAFTIASDAEATNIPLWLDHVDDKHNMHHPSNQNARLKDALAFA